jgi:hypothetical protein
MMVHASNIARNESGPNYHILRPTITDTSASVLGREHFGEAAKLSVSELSML